MFRIHVCRLPFRPFLTDQYSSKLTRLVRAIRLFFHIAFGLLTAALVLPRVSPQKRDSIIRNWSQGLLVVFNIRLIIHGTVPGSQLAGVMFVANHVSWLDIHVIHSICTVRFIAMAEIRRWPIFGWLAQQANTLFTDRTRRQDAGRMVEITTDSLQAGDCLCYFPEGTTTEGNELKPFKASLMQAAINAGTYIWPVAIRYPDINGQSNPEMSYANANLFGSLKKVLAQQTPIAEVYFSEPIPAAGQDRRHLSALARASIAQSLGLTR